MRMTGYFAVMIIGWVMLSDISFGAIYGGGSGTVADPYQIWTREQMNTIGINSADWGKCFKLMADIDMSVYTGTEYHIIGYDTLSFTGVFDGNGHVIRNLTYINTGSGLYVGLFGYTYNATIKNLGLENININVRHNQGKVRWVFTVGGLIGQQDNGTIVNCFCTGNISICSYDYMDFAASTVGGLVGELSSGTITNCYTVCSIVSTAVYMYSDPLESHFSSCAGGLFGGNSSGIVKNCYSKGSVSVSASSSTKSYSNVGGLGAGNYHGTLANCYSTASISSSVAYSSTGGLVPSNNDGTITSCFWDIYSSHMNTSAGGTGKTTTQMKTLSTFTSAGWDFANETANGTNDIWRMCADGVDYPRLNWESIDGDFVCPDGVGGEDLDYFVGRWLLNDCTSSNNYCGGVDGDASGTVDLADWAVFAEHWLEGV
jgi:hypothetical protein